MKNNFQQQESTSKTIEKGVYIHDGKVFESRMLGDLSGRAILESFIETLSKYMDRNRIDMNSLERATAHVLITKGEKKGLRKWESFSDFLQKFSTNIMSKDSTESLKATAYNDFNEIFSQLKDRDNKQLINLLERDPENNFSLDVAIGTKKELLSTNFSKGIIRKLSERFPDRKFILVNGLGTPMDHLQKIDFVVAVADERNKIKRYYSYDLKTDPDVESSSMIDVVLIRPDYLNSNLEEITSDCIDKVVEDVVERESGL